MQIIRILDYFTQQEIMPEVQIKMFMVNGTNVTQKLPAHLVQLHITLGESYIKNFMCLLDFFILVGEDHRFKHGQIPKY